MHTQSIPTKRQMHISSSANARADGTDEGIKLLSQIHASVEPCGGAWWSAVRVNLTFTLNVRFRNEGMLVF